MESRQEDGGNDEDEDDVIVCGDGVRLKKQFAKTQTQERFGTPVCGLRWPSRRNGGGWAKPGKAEYNSAVLRDLTLSVAEASCTMTGTPRTLNFPLLRLLPASRSPGLL